MYRGPEGTLTLGITKLYFALVRYGVVRVFVHHSMLHLRIEAGI